jgi:hypothetical protein
MISQAKKLEEKAFNELVDGVQALYPEPLPQAEAEEAARNLARLYKTILNIKREQFRNKQKQSKNEGDSP